MRSILTSYLVLYLFFALCSKAEEALSLEYTITAMQYCSNAQTRTLHCNRASVNTRFRSYRLCLIPTRVYDFCNFDDTAPYCSCCTSSGQWADRIAGLWSRCIQRVSPPSRHHYFFLSGAACRLFPGRLGSGSWEDYFYCTCTCTSTSPGMMTDGIGILCGVWRPQPQATGRKAESLFIGRESLSENNHDT